VPYGFPAGGNLLAFAKEPNPPDEWWPLVKGALDADKAVHAEFVAKLIDSGAPSLDHFSGKVREYKEYAKALVAYYIGRAESRDNLLNANETFDWSRFFIQQLVDDLEFSNIDKTQISVVTFNFDRSFEQALLIRLSTVFSKSGKQVAEAIAHWNFIHVHGSLGQLPEFATSGAGRPYQHNPDPERLKLDIQGIKLLDDAEADSPEFQQAQELIQEADVLFILGFAFHRVNCERVIPQQWSTEKSPPQIFGTTHGMSDGAINKAKSHFRSGPSLTPYQGDCLSLLKHYEHIFSD
jgi:hypothetical protein